MDSSRCQNKVAHDDIINELKNLYLAEIKRRSRMLSRYEEVVLIIGPTGSGKSTLTHYLMGHSFKFVDDPLTLIKKIEFVKRKDMTEGPNIAKNNGDLCTLHAEVFTSKKANDGKHLWLCDTPAYNGGDAVTESCCALISAHLAVKNFQKIKSIIVTVPWQVLFGGSEKSGIKKLVTTLLELFEPQSIQLLDSSSIFFAITHIPYRLRNKIDDELRRACDSILEKYIEKFKESSLENTNILKILKVLKIRINQFIFPRITDEGKSCDKILDLLQGRDVLSNLSLHVSEKINMHVKFLQNALKNYIDVNDIKKIITQLKILLNKRKELEIEIDKIKAKIWINQDREEEQKLYVYQNSKKIKFLLADWRKQKEQSYTKLQLLTQKKSEYLDEMVKLRQKLILSSSGDNDESKDKDEEAYRLEEFEKLYQRTQNDLSLESKKINQFERLIESINADIIDNAFETKLSSTERKLKLEEYQEKLKLKEMELQSILDDIAKDTKLFSHSDFGSKIDLIIWLNDILKFQDEDIKEILLTYTAFQKEEAKNYSDANTSKREDRNAKFQDNNVDQKQVFPLHFAVQEGLLEILPHLIQENGFSLDETDNAGFIPLEYAVIKGDEDVCALLLDLGTCAENTLNNRRFIFRALQLSLLHNRLIICQLLLAHPLCDLGMRTDDNGDTLLHVAARYNSIRILPVLVAQRQLWALSFDVKNLKGYSPIHVAAKNNSIEVLSYLVAAGADIDAKVYKTVENNKLHLTALDIAIIEVAENDDLKKETIIKKLLALGASISKQTRRLAMKDRRLNGLVSNEVASRERLNLQQVNYRNRKLSHIRNLVFKGGGVKGIAYVGALSQLLQLEGEDFLNKIERIAGASAGAITAFLLSVGFSMQEFSKEMESIQLDVFMDSDDKELVDNLLMSIKEGMSIDQIFGRIFSSLKQPIHQLGKTVSKINETKNNIKQKNYFRALQKGLQASAHGYVAYDMISESSQQGIKSLKQIKSLLSTIKNYYGIFPGQRALSIFKRWLLGKGLSETLTFGELRELRKRSPEKYKHLYIAVTNLSQSRTEIFSTENRSSANILIIDAVRASMAVPLFFRPHQIRQKKSDGSITLLNGDYYVDGGVLFNYPINLFDFMHYIEPNHSDQLKDTDIPVFNTQTLGLFLASPLEHNQLLSLDPISNSNPKITFDITQYIWNFICLYSNHEDNLHARKGNSKRTIYIDNVGVSLLDFALDKDRQRSLIYAGQVAVISYHQNCFRPTKKGIMNFQLLSALLMNATSAFPGRSQTGMSISSIKVAINTPQELFNILKFVNTDDELAFIRELSIDFNVKDLNNYTVCHLAALELNLSQAVMQKAQAKKVFRWLIHLGSSCIDFNIQSCDGTVLDLIMSKSELPEEWVVAGLIEVGALTSENNFHNQNKFEMEDIESKSENSKNNKSGDNKLLRKKEKDQEKRRSKLSQPLLSNSILQTIFQYQSNSSSMNPALPRPSKDNGDRSKRQKTSR